MNRSSCWPSARLYEKKEYGEAATRAAQQSATLHGPYSIWDFGDQPAKLLAEIDAARARNQASPPPAAADCPRRHSGEPDAAREPGQRVRARPGSG